MKNFADVSRFFGKIMLPAVVAATFVSCDEVAQDDRYIPLPELQNVERTVLLQDFTGQNCVNCPAAHEIMELLSDQYGENLICVSVHAGDLAVPVNRTNYNTGRLGLRTDEGDTYNDAAGVGHWPMGTVDGGPALDPDDWATWVRARLELEELPAASIKLEATLSDGMIHINSDLVAPADFKGKYQLWIVESGLIGSQRTESGNKLDYVHNHVFRCSVNGTWGEDISLDEGIHRNLSHSIAMRYTDTERWNADNITVVGFVSDGSGVQQAAQCSLQIND